MAMQWGTAYITEKEIFMKLCSKIGIKFRIWGKNFTYYEITIDENGNVTKKNFMKYDDISACADNHKPHEILQFLLNHVCDLETINGLR